MEGGLAGIHELLGGLVVMALVVTALLAAFQVTKRDDAATGGDALRIVSYAAAALLLLQYLLGFLLLAGNARNSMEHYIIALLAIIPVGLQHSSGRRLAPRTQGVAMLIWALAAAFLAILAYLTGMRGVG